MPVELLTWLSVLHDTGEVVELRAIGKPTLSGYFKIGQDEDAIEEWLAAYPNATFYQTMNAIDPALYSREQSGRILQNPKQTTADGDIKELRWLLIDADPKRPSGISSTDAEKAAALGVMRRVYATLKQQGFCEPVVADSGNGYHLLYRISAKPAFSEVIRDFLLVMNMTFSNEQVDVDIDTAVFNPARITKLYGTMATKGTSTPQRPHRPSRIIRIPEKIEPTSGALIQRIANQLPKPEPTQRGGYESFDVFDFCARHGIGYREQSSSVGKKLVLDECPFNADHKAPDAAIFVMTSGAIGFKCLHNSCSGKTWHDVREHYEPDAYRHETHTVNPEIAKRIDEHIRAKTFEPTEEEDEEPRFINITDVPPLDTTKRICIPSGIGALDAMLTGGGFAKGEMSVWSGSNGSGKSTVTSQLAIEAVNAGFRVAMFSGELNASTVRNWLTLQAAGHDGVWMPGKTDYWIPKDEAREKVNEALNGQIYLYDNTRTLYWETVLTAIEKEVKEHSIDMVILDNLMALDYKSAGSSANYDVQGEITKTMSRMAKALNIHIHFICHPKKEQNGYLLRKNDISGSGDITNWSDNVLMVSRVTDDFSQAYKNRYKRDPKETADNCIEVMKQRNGNVVDGWAWLWFDPSCKTFSDNPNQHRVYKWHKEAAIDVTNEVADEVPW